MHTTIYRVNTPSVIYEQFEGELVAIHLETGAYHSLFGAGADAFLLLNQEASIEEMATVLATKYDGAPESIAAALQGFVDALIAEQLIAIAETPVARGPLQLEPAEPKLPFVPPTLEAYHDLQSLFLLDPVHEVGTQGWPQPLHTPEEGKTQA